jgi:hypothetical protein
MLSEGVDSPNPDTTRRPSLFVASDANSLNKETIPFEDNNKP